MTRICPAGHVHSAPDTYDTPLWFRLLKHDMDITKTKYGQAVNISDYLCCYIPRRAEGNFSGGTTPLHLLGSTQCSSCSSSTSLASVSIHWPQILNITAYHRGDISFTANNSIDYTNTITIKDSEGLPVTYDLIGRQIHSGDHFTAQVRLGTQEYTYNDMSGNLKLLTGTDRLETPNLGTVCYIYSRSSSKYKVFCATQFTFGCF